MSELGVVAASPPNAGENAIDGIGSLIVATLLIFGIGFILRELRSIAFSYEIPDDAFYAWRRCRRI